MTSFISKERHAGFLHGIPAEGGFPIRFPSIEFGDKQDLEWCEVYFQQKWQKFRFHDYGRIYQVPGLYEHLFYRVLECNSPRTLASLLNNALVAEGQSPRTLRALDFGAGNGMVGEELRRIGIHYLIGADLLDEAAEATERDRPGLYDQYLVADFCNLSVSHQQALAAADLNLLVTVAALGFGDIPCQAFLTALSHIQSPGWVAFNIKEDFLSRKDSTGFCSTIQKLMDQEVLQIQSYRRYVHRRNAIGKRLYYVAVVAKKLKELPK